jgi:hypothetical protein
VLSKIYLEQLAIGALISRISFRAPTLYAVTPPGVLPALRQGLQGGCNAAAMSAETGRCGCSSLTVWLPRSIAVEFGPAEAIDSITIRPVALYLGPLIVERRRPALSWAALSVTSLST